MQAVGLRCIGHCLHWPDSSLLLFPTTVPRSWYNVAVFVFFTTGLGLWSAAGDIGRDTESY